MRLLDVLLARRRIAPYVRRTPLVRSSWLSDLSGADVWLKLESAQHSHSFKWRGAFNAVIARLERGTPKLDAPRHRLGRQSRTRAGRRRRNVRPAADGVHAGRRATGEAGGDRAPRRGAAGRQPRLRRGGTARKGVCQRDRRGVHLAVQRRRRDRRRGHRRARDLRGRRGHGHARRSDRRRRADQRRGRGRQGRRARVRRRRRRGRGVLCRFRRACARGNSSRSCLEPSLADGLGGNPDPDTITFEPIQRLVDQLVTVSETDLEDALVGLVDGRACHRGRRRRRRHRRPSSGSASTSQDAAWRRFVSGANIDRARLAALLA